PGRVSVFTVTSGFAFSKASTTAFADLMVAASLPTSSDSVLLSPPEPELAFDPPSPELQAVNARATATAAVASRIAEVFMGGLRMGLRCLRTTPLNVSTSDSRELSAYDMRRQALG